MQKTMENKKYNKRKGQQFIMQKFSKNRVNDAFSHSITGNKVQNRQKSQDIPAEIGGFK